MSSVRTSSGRGGKPTGPVRGTFRGLGKASRGIGRAGKGAATGTTKAVRAVGSLKEPGQRRKLLFRLVGLFLILILGYLAVTFVQVLWSSRRDGARDADVAVVLGAAQYNGRPSDVLKGRLDHALELYEDDVVDKIVVTGGRQAGDRYTEAAAGYAYLRREGVPEADILREEQGTNTWESLAAAARILRNRNLTDAVLVTDGYHALRVDAIADELGLDASVSPSRKGGAATDLVKETGAVAIGRIVGFRRLVSLDDHISSTSE